MADLILFRFMQALPAKLPFALDCLNRNLPLSPTLLTSLLASLPPDPKHSSTHALLHMVRILQDNPPSVTPSATESAPKIAAYLQALLPLLEIKSPMLELTAANHSRFSQKCTNLHSDSTLKLVQARSYGLFPPYQKGAVHVPLYLRSDEGQSERCGNPNWLMSRVALSKWHGLNRSHLSQASQQVCEFLLGGRDFLARWSHDNLKRIWAIVYVRYISTVLEDHSLRVPQQLVTWLPMTLDQFNEEMRQASKGIDGLAKVYLDLLGCLTFTGTHQQYLDVLGETFQGFMQHYIQSPTWHYCLVLSLFKKMAERHGHPLIAERCTQRYLRLLGNTENEHSQGITQFLGVLLPQRQLIEHISRNSLQYWLLPLRLNQFQSLIRHFLLNGRVHPQAVKYLLPQHYAECVFRSDKWAERGFADSMAIALEEQGLFAKKLAEILRVGNLQMVQENVRRFIEAWRGYHFELKDILTQEQLLFHLMLLDQEAFDVPLRSVFLLPSESPPVILDLLSKTVQLFKEKIVKEGREKAREEARGLGVHLGRLISRLSEGQRAELQGVWIEVMGSEEGAMPDYFHL